MNRYFNILCCIILFSNSLFASPYNNSVTEDDNEDQFISFSIPGKTAPAVIDHENGTIDINLAKFTDVFYVKPTFYTTPLATVTINGYEQASGISFLSVTEPVVYTVTDVNGIERDYTLTVTVDDSCGEELQSSGLMNSSANKDWWITPNAPGDIATIHFSDVSFSGGSDEIRIRDGGPNGPLLAAYDDNDLARPVSSTEGLHVSLYTYSGYNSFDIEFTNRISKYTW